MRAWMPICVASWWLVGCVPAAGAPPSPEGATAAAVDALQRGDVSAAAQDVERAVTGVPDGPRISHALLLGAVLYLHPRNAKRNPDRAAELAARYVAAVGDARERELGVALFEVALDLGADPRPAASGKALARLPRGLGASEHRIERLQQEIERLQKELTRIRETLKH